MSWKDYVQPVGMMSASFMNLMGAVIHQSTSDNDRDNPFYYTAMITSAMYMISNAYAVKRAYDTHAERELSRSLHYIIPLEEVVIKR